MPFVTDTHPLVYFHSGKDAKLSRRALRIFRDAEHGRDIIFIPVVVFLEIDALLRRGRIALKEGSLIRWADKLLDYPGFVVQDITLEIALESTAQGLLGDPMDSLIVAAAKVAELPLITSDQRIIESGLVEVVR
jgi:PIN domain nuclease of toxin-antitoxin system